MILLYALVAITELSAMLLELMLDFHAWSSARPLHESDKTADTLEKEINELMETEKDQGRSSVSHQCPTFIGRRYPSPPLGTCFVYNADIFFWCLKTKPDNA